MNQSLTFQSPTTASLSDAIDQCTIANDAFSSFLVEKRNLQLLWIAALATIIQFIVFKQLYPFPDFFSDSYSYLFAAYAHLNVNIWPIGYSKFLLLFHYLTHSSTAVIAFQYFLLELAAAFFFFTLIYITPLTILSKVLLFFFLFFNPLFLYISNYINSDPLFASLSLLWFTNLLWILHKPNIYQLLSQALLLFLCFTVRNNAYYYPIITAIALLLTKQNWKLKALGFLLPSILIIPFIFYTRNIAYEITGTRQYSLFTGWQLANNALYMRGHIKIDSLQLPDAKTRQLDIIARHFFSHTTPAFDDYLTSYVANYFIRQPEAPLKKYYTENYVSNDEYEDIVNWGKASAVFGSYGSYLISNYPFKFLKYYLLRNTKNYFLPPLEKLEIYNLGMNEVLPIAKYWFNFKTYNVTAFSKNGQGKILSLYPFLFFFVNIYLIGNLILNVTTKRVSYSPIIKRLIILITSFLMINFGFSILATINVFRYQFFPMILFISLSLLFMDLTTSHDFKKQNIIPYAK